MSRHRPYTYGNIDGQTKNSGLTSFLAKFNPNGTKEWTKFLESTAIGDHQVSVTGLTTGVDGAIYVSGYEIGDLDGQTNAGNSDTFLMKYNVDGTRVWAKLFGSVGYEFSTALSTTFDGAVYITGYTNEGLGGQAWGGGPWDAFLTKVITNNPPFFTSNASSSMLENVSTSTAVYTATATDPDANTTLIYSISGVDAGLFNINANSGAITFKAFPNFEAPTDTGANNVYDILVQASDGSLMATKAVAILITNVNEAPVITSGLLAIADENVATSTTVYSVTATDPDAGTTLTYSISGGADANLFNINATTGAVTFKASPNFEAPADAGPNNVYDITVRASDGSLYADKAVAISVTDVSEAATYAVSAGATSVNEGSSATFTLTTTNVASGTVVPYTLSGVTAADIVGGAMSGNATVSANGQATITVAIAADGLTEGSETLTVTAGGVSASTTVIDASLIIVNSSVAQYRALGSTTISPTDSVTLMDTGANLSSLTAAEITALAGKYFDFIDSTNNVLSLSVAQYTALGMVALTAADVVTLADTGANIAALTAAQFGVLATNGVDKIDATDNALSLTASQYFALTATGCTLAFGDVVILAGTGANVASLSAAQLGALAGNGVDKIDATDNALWLTMSQYLALIATSTTLTFADVVTLTDTGANIASLTAAQLGALAANGIDKISNLTVLSVAQYRALLATPVTWAGQRDWRHLHVITFVRLDHAE